MKTERRFNTKALEALSPRVNALKSENALAGANEDNERQIAVGLILKGNEASRLSRRHVQRSIDTLVSVLDSPTARDRDKIEAARLLLDRAHGKPAIVAQESIEEIEEVDIGLAQIEQRTEAIEWMNSGKSVDTWPEHVRRHLGLDDTESPDR